MPDINIPTAITSWDIGDILAGSSQGRSARIPGSIGPDLMVLAQRGDGKKSAKPFWSPLSGIIPGLAAIAFSGSASDLIGGTIPAARFPAFTGDVTNPVGSLVTTISQKAVSNDKLAFMPPMTIKGNNSILPGAPKDLTVADLNAMGVGGGGGGSGTVTSVGLSLPAIFSVAGSPVTTAGTFTVTLATELANTVWAGPATGAAATPIFRTLALADIPDLSTIYQPLNAKLTAFGSLANTLGFLHNDGAGVLTWAAAGTGTVTSVSVVSANGLAGTVATATTTPAITLSTTITGILKGNATAISAAAAGTDYVAPGPITTDGITMSTARLLGRTTAGTGAVEEITLGTNLSFTGTTLNASGGAGSPAGSNTQVQYNNVGAFGASSGFTFDDTTKELVLTGSLGSSASVRAHVENGNAAGNADFLALNNVGEFAISLVTGASALAFGFVPSNTGLFATNGAAGMWLGTLGVNAPVLFCQNSVEKARISTSGNLLVGSTSNFGITSGGVRAEAAYFNGYTRIGSGFGAGPYLSIDSGDYTLIQLSRGNSVKFELGTAGSTNDFVTGSVQDDMGFVSRASKSILFSADNGTTQHLKITASTGAIKIGAYTTAGLLSNDASGNVTTATVGTGLSLSAGVLSASGASTPPAGSNTQIQFNNAGAFGASADLTWSGATAGLTIIGNSLAGSNPTLKITDSVANEPVWARVEQTSVNAAFEFGIAGAAGQFFGDAHAGDGIFKGFLASPGMAIGGGASSPLTSLYIKYGGFGAKGRVIVGGVTDDGTNDLQVLDNAFIKNSLTIGNGSGSGPFLKINSVDYTLLQYARGGASKFSTGTANAANDFITGSVQDDMAFKSDASKSILFSTDNGSSIGLKLTSGNGNAIFGAAIQTATPTSGTAAAWKLGSKVTAGVTPDLTGYIEVDIGGTLFKVALVT